MATGSPHQPAKPVLKSSSVHGGHGGHGGSKRAPAAVPAPSVAVQHFAVGPTPPLQAISLDSSAQSERFAQPLKSKDSNGDDALPSLGEVAAVVADQITLPGEDERVEVEALLCEVLRVTLVVLLL